MTSFVLGIACVVGVILVTLTVYSFVKIVKLNAKILILEIEIDSKSDELFREIYKYSELDNRRIDGEIERTDQITTELYRYTDSRLDKLENKLVVLIQSGTESNSKSKKLIKE